MLGFLFNTLANVLYRIELNGKERKLCCGNSAVKDPLPANKHLEIYFNNAEAF